MNYAVYLTVKSKIRSLLLEASDQQMTFSDLLDQQSSFFHKQWSLEKANITFKTYGDIQNLLKGVRQKQRLTLGAKIIKKILSSFLPGAVGTGIDILTSLYYAKNPAKSGTVIDELTVDPYVAAIVDDAVEAQFVKDFYNHIIKQPADKELPPPL